MLRRGPQRRAVDPPTHLSAIKTTGRSWPDLGRLPRSPQPPLRSTRTTSPVTGSCHQRHHNCLKPEAKMNSTGPAQWSRLRPTLEATVGEGIKLLVVKHEEAKWGWYRYPEGGGRTRRVRFCGASPRWHGSGDWSKTYERIPEGAVGASFLRIRNRASEATRSGVGHAGKCIRDREKPSGAKRAMAHGRATVSPSLPSRTDVAEPDPA